MIKYIDILKKSDANSMYSFLTEKVFLKILIRNKRCNFTFYLFNYDSNLITNSFNGETSVINVKLNIEPLCKLKYTT